MKLTVVVEGQKFNVACGTGTQDIKWLALTATTLYGMKVGGGAGREGDRRSLCWERTSR